MLRRRFPLGVNLRRSPVVPATSGAGSRADAIGAKVDVELECPWLGVDRPGRGHGPNFSG